MKPILYHTLKNFVRGWSKFYINPIDIRKITNIYYNKRLFCIFDPEYEYTLRINYYNPRIEYIINNIVIYSIYNYTPFINIPYISEQYVEESYMTLRYKTECEVKKEIEKIKKLQDKIKEFDRKQNNKFIIKKNLA